VGDASILQLVASPLLSPRCTGTEVELVLARAPATGADSDEIGDLVAMAWSGFLNHVHEVTVGGIWINGLTPVGQLIRWFDSFIVNTFFDKHTFVLSTL
jgi:hypothetical protein